MKKSLLRIINIFTIYLIIVNYCYADNTEEFDGVYSFGDSFTSDSSSWAANITKKYSYPFTDGKTNLASGGGNVFNLNAQLNTYLSANSSVKSNALYLVYMGPSDIAQSFNNFYTLELITHPLFNFAIGSTALEAAYKQNPNFATFFPQTANDISLRVDAYSRFISNLVNGGARYILIANHHDDSLRQEGVPNDTFANTIWSEQFFNSLHTSIQSNSPSANIIYVDTFRFVNEVVQDPTKYLTSSQIQGTKNNQGFFINAHPTNASYKLLSDYVISVIEAPSRISFLREQIIANGNKVTGRLFDYSQSFLSKKDYEKRFQIELEGNSQYTRSQTFSNKDLGTKANFNNDAGITLNLYPAERYLFGGSIHYFYDINKFAKNTGQGKLQEVYYSLHNTYKISDQLFVHGGLGIGHIQYNIDRKIPLGINIRSHKGKTKGKHFLISAGVGYQISISNNYISSLTPIINLTRQRVSMDSYQEKGELNSTRMSYIFPKRESTQLEAGVNIKTKEYKYKEVEITPSIMMSYKHEFNDPLKKRVMGRVSGMPKYFAVPAYSIANNFTIEGNLGMKFKHAIHLNLKASTENIKTISGIISLKAEF